MDTIRTEKEINPVEKAQGSPDRFENLYAKYEGDRTFAREILGILVRDVPPLLEGLEEAFRGNEPELIIKKAHSLSNISGTVLEMKIHSLAQAMEKSAREDDIAGSAALYGSVKPLVRELYDAARAQLAEAPPKHR